MALIVVERRFQAPVVFEELEAQEAAVAWCLEQHRVKPLRSLLSFDARSAVCVYEAPDAEAVRSTQDEGQLAYEHVWPAQLVEPPERNRPPGYSTVVVQRELPETIDQPDAVAMYLAARDCLERNRALLWHSYLALDGRRMVCRYYAPDAEGVRRANHESALPSTAIWPAKVYGDADG